MVLSATSVHSLENSGSSYSLFLKQALFFVVSLFVVIIGSRMKMELWEGCAKLSLLACSVALVLPLIPGVGHSVNGNSNWIGAGVLTFQPSEFAKMGLILWCAMQLRRHADALNKGYDSNGIARLAAAPAIFLILIMIGKDLGTALIVGGIAFCMVYLSGTKGSHMLSLALGGIILLIGFIVMQPYRMHRFAAILDPFNPAIYKLAGWQPAHSQMALASGGLFGVGLGASKQKWANLSEAHTDFIYSVIGEETGLLGTLTVVILFAILIFAIFRISITTKDSFSKYAVAGVGCWFVLQVLINLGTNVGIFPVIGVTLPFISYGGSSLVANFIAVAFVLNVCRREPGVQEAIARRRKVTS